MKLKRCFIDEFGNIWKDKTLFEASKDLPIIQFDVESISLDEEIRWKIEKETMVMNICCINTQKKIKSDYQKRIDELETAIHKFLEVDQSAYDSDLLRFELELHQKGFKKLLKK